MQLSQQTKTDILAITKGKMLPYSGVLYIYFTYLMPGLKSSQIRELLSALHIACEKDVLIKLINMLNHERILIIQSNGISTPAQPIDQEQLKRWQKEPLLQNLIKYAREATAEILRGVRPAQRFSVRIMLHLLMLGGQDKAAWQLLNHAEKIKPENIESRSDYPYTTHHKVRYLEKFRGKPYTDISEIDAELYPDFLPTLYRNTSLRQLPQYLTHEQITATPPLKHDEKDNISDIALFVAMHTGKWELFDHFSRLPGTSYHLTGRLSAFDYCSHFHSCNLANVAESLRNWRAGKWQALKKLKDIFHYTRKSYIARGAWCDLPLRAFLAPLIFIMRLKIANTHIDHVFQAKDALREFYGNAADDFIFNASLAMDLQAKEFGSVKWEYTQPLALLPKALCLASMGSMPEVSAPELEQMCEACFSLHRSGLTMYSWYMANALLCLPGLSPQHTTELESIFNSRQDLPLFCEIEKKNGIYDHLLDDLQNLLADTAATTPQQNGCISWVLHYNEKHKTAEQLEIFAHKKLKKGNYSVGKHITVSALCSGEYDSYMHPKDKEILNHLHKFTIESMWDLYHKVTPKLAQLLVGHPRITLVDKHKRTAIQLQEEPLTLNVKKEKGGITLNLQKINAYYGVPIRRIDDNTYAIITANNKAETLKAFIAQHSVNSNKLTLPEQYQDRLLSILSGFTDAVTITGDIVGEKAKTIKATPKVIALLSPGKATLCGKLMLELYPQTPPVSYYSKEKLLFSHIAGKAVNISRNTDEENALRQQIAQACPVLQEVMDDTGTWQMELSDHMLQVVDELQQCPPALLETRWQEGRALRISRMDDFTAFNIKTSTATGEWLSIGGQVQVNEQMVLQLGTLLRNISNTTGRYIELSEGQFLKLSKNIEEQLRALSTLTTPAKKGKRSEEKVAVSPALLLMMAQHHGVEALPAALHPHAEQLLQRFHTAFYKPRNLNATLRDYQTEGYEWMQRLMNSGLGACLADDMGLGKTLQVLSILLARAADGPSLVIAPASVCTNWSTEAAKFTPTLNIHQLENADREQLVSKLGKRDVLVCSYGLLVTESDLLTTRKWNVAVLDEAQYIKNSQTQRARTACALKAKCRIAATGTPIENSLDELWSIFDFINPGYLGSQELFRERFANNPARRKLLRRIVAPFVLRRLKGDVLDELPDKTEITRTITLNEQERSLYEACRRDALLKAQQCEDRFTILAQLMRMRRLCCHPQLVDEHWQAESGKITALCEMAAELHDSGHKALIFSQFTDMLALVRARFEQEGFSYLYLDGSTPKTKRGKLVDAFQNGEADFFLISLKAGGTGLNLTAADYVILLDPWWNPAVETQAADRTHRIGQKRPVTVCRFVCQDTIEERVMQLHAQKRELFDQVINDTAPAAPLSLAELRELM